MRLGKNFLAGLSNSVWSVLVNLAAVPFYINYLGIEAYGLIGFFITIQTVLQLLDMGITPTINREVARCMAIGDLTEAGPLIHTLAVIYWCLAVFILFSIFCLAPFISEYWLKSTLESGTLLHAVMLMGVVIAFRWPKALYQGVLIGAERLTISSAVNILMVTMANLGAVLVLAFYSPTIEAFFIWQAGVALLFSLVMRTAAWRVVGTTTHLKFDIEKLKSVWRFTAGMSGVAVSGMILMQLDKVLLSKITSLEDFGRYSLAVVVASGLYVFLFPLFNVIYPRLSAYVATGREQETEDFYRKGTLLFLAIFFPVAIFVTVFSEQILHLWTGDLLLAKNVAPIATFFLIGTALNGVMHFPYALQLAYGKTRLPLSINTILILIMIPSIVILAQMYGAVGGAVAWAITNLLYVFVGTALTHRLLLKKIGTKWLLHDVGLPLAVAAMVVGAGGYLVSGYQYPHYVVLLIGSGLVVISFVATMLVSARLRNMIRILLSNDIGAEMKL